MSGFAVVFNSKGQRILEKMLPKIEFRGTYRSGKFIRKNVSMAQNYLRADIQGGLDASFTPDQLQVPAFTSQDLDFRICYDGQMGNWQEKAHAFEISDGPLREERLFLILYFLLGNQMFEHLDDAIFAFVISDGEHFLAARDLLGIKTLFYGKKNGALYFASELKSLTAVTDQVYEFPPGHYMTEDGQLIKFAELPRKPLTVTQDDPDQITKKIRDIITRSLHNRLDFSMPTASLLSGGIDSSVIAWLATKMLKERLGQATRLKTFALGVGESEDIKNARRMADHINSDHHEHIVDLDQILAVLPEVIWHLESFDPSLVRSSVSNYLISQHARAKGVEVLLSGEGGDEVFCGYQYLKNYPNDELFARQIECIGFLHNNAALRLDRMNQCNSMRVVAPLISGELLQYALCIPSEYKIKDTKEGKIEKWIFRKAFENDLPREVVWRIKQEFSQGSGSAAVLKSYFNESIKDEEFKAFHQQYPKVRSKEELYYFKIFITHFGDGHAVDTVGQWILL